VGGLFNDRAGVGESFVVSGVIESKLVVQLGGFVSRVLEQPVTYYFETLGIYAVREKQPK
jgi:hypothetical protein